MQELLIQDLMSTELVTVNHDDIVSEVAKIFEEQSIHHVIVVNNDGDLEGIISSTDIDRTRSGASFFRNPKKEEYDAAILSTMRACDIMTRDVVTLHSTDSIRRAYDIFKANKFHAIPVVSKGLLKGIITPIDILDHFFN